MEYQETELEMLKQEISRKDEPLARQRFQIEDLVARNTELKHKLVGTGRKDHD